MYVEEDMDDIPPPVPDQTTFGGNNGTKGGGLTDMTSDSEGSEPAAGGLRLSDSEGYDTDLQRERHRHRHRRVRFTTPNTAPWADLLNNVHETFQKSEEDQQRQHLELVDMIRKSDEDRQQQHRVLLDMIRGLQGSTMRTYRDGPPPHDPDFSPGD
ncbi:hypothetical protein Ddye_022661 [Dipteronia dyeriana]|uniref:Uncharacterized protein n=1 Tax=Dipteronia dyeriana TaxID=168575 RepID=A0AAD9TSF6_9ROSI|nr:hypothetical protein Ddye_022661 [Dipteronia dyeriana]